MGQAGIEPATLGLKRLSAVSACLGVAGEAPANRRFLADLKPASFRPVSVALAITSLTPHVRVDGS
jgi:hypothetical protein